MGLEKCLKKLLLRGVTRLLETVDGSKGGVVEGSSDLHDELEE